ncbi:hypothetical protein [Phormidesmis priestleyi]
MKEISDSDKPIAMEVLLKMYEIKYMLANQAEDQRAAMSNFLITITAATFAFISQQGSSHKTILMSLLTIFLG